MHNVNVECKLVNGMKSHIKILWSYQSIPQICQSDKKTLLPPSSDVLAQTRRQNGQGISSSSPVFRWWVGRPTGRCRWQWPNTAELPAAAPELDLGAFLPAHVLLQDFRGTWAQKGWDLGRKMPGQLQHKWVWSKISGSVCEIELELCFILKHHEASKCFDRWSPTGPDPDQMDLHVQAAWVHRLVHRCQALKRRLTGCGGK